MRTLIASALLLLPLAVSAQPAPDGATITREQFIARAAAMAGRRFDAIDVTHSGTITRDQLRAWRQAHGGAASPQ